MSDYYSITDINISNKNLLVREDLNVPIKDQVILSEKRIDAIIPSIKYMLENGARVCILSHMGRPDEGSFDKNLSLESVAKKISEKIGINVHFEKRPIDEYSPDYKNKITLYENIRFIKGEKIGDQVLAKKIVKNCDIFVMDAFAAAHRTHCSSYTLAKFAPVTCAGPLMISEIKNLQKFSKNPKKPLLAIIGGAKVSTKLNILSSIIKKVDMMILGGGIANTFMMAKGINVGNSLVEEKLINDARAIIEYAKSNNVTLPLPIDVACDNNGEQAIKKSYEIQSDDIIKDIGPETINIYKSIIDDAKTIIWNGPLGIFEEKNYELGTKKITEIISESNAFTVAGGGDTISAIEKYSELERISYTSTGGGAFLEYLEDKELPGISIIKK